MHKQISQNLTVELTKIKPTQTKTQTNIEGFIAINKTNSRYIFLILIMILILVYTHKYKLL